MASDWHALYDEVKRLGEFGSDAQLAESLGLTRAQISAWRTGKSDLGALAKLKILDVLGHDSLRSAVLSLLPERNRDELERLHIKLTERVSRGMQAQVCTMVMPNDGPLARDENRLLARLHAEERARFMPHLTPVSIPLGKVLYEPGDRLTHLYLPTTAIIATLHVTDSGGLAEAAVIGRDGVLGVPLFTGRDTATNRAVVQSAGEAFQLSAQVAIEEFVHAGYVQRIFLRYTQALITQMSQTAVCNRHHSITQKFCRWLLLSLDRLQNTELHVAQELTANMLGVRRTKVAEVAKQLENTGAIRYHGGRIQVLDRAGLEVHVCDCYSVIQSEYERLFQNL
jgi:CRP-like cAMP-binding protein